MIKPLISKAFYEVEKIEKIDDKFCFLIVGGSQGAKIFDEILKEVILEISRDFSIKIIQQTHKDNIDNLKNFYVSNNIDNLIFNFEENFFDLINVSDLCITRAGATTLAEISFLNKPFIAIPLPYSKDNHQMMNAKYYEKKGCCWVIDQKKLDKEKLSIFIKDLLKDKKDLINKKKNLQKLNHDNTRKYIYGTSTQSGFNCVDEVNFGQKSFTHSIPTGYTKWQQDNVPTTDKGVSGLVWTKNRDASDDHQLYDSLRGKQLRVTTDSTAVEATVIEGVQKFLKGGHSIGSDDAINTSGETFITWNWTGNGGTSVTNDASATGVGDIDSVYQANTTAGFSIVTYTGTGSNGTIAHGLGSKPHWVMSKPRSIIAVINK